MIKWGNTSVGVMKCKIGQSYLKNLHEKRKIQTEIFRKSCFFVIENKEYRVD